MIADMAQQGASFAVHAGDIKSGSTVCSDEVYQDILGVFQAAPLPEGCEISGLFSGRLRFIANRRDLDLTVIVYEQLAGGKVFELASWLQRVSYAKDRGRRQLLRPGRIQQLDFQAQRLVGQLAETGFALLNPDLRQPSLYGIRKNCSICFKNVLFNLSPN